MELKEDAHLQELCGEVQRCECLSAVPVKPLVHLEESGRVNGKEGGGGRQWKVIERQWKR